MSKIFLDIGAHRGQTLEMALKDYPDCEAYYGIEPVAEMVAACRANPALQGDRIRILPVAADALGKQEMARIAPMHVDPANRYLGSSLLLDKTIRKPVLRQVLCLDIEFLFSLLVRPRDEVYLKIDIEGKEYDILERLRSSGLLAKHVIRIFVEWHWHKTQSISRDRHDRLLDSLCLDGYRLAGTKADAYYEGD